MTSIALLCLLLGAENGVASEKLPPGTEVVALTARPTSVELTSEFAYAQVLLTAELNDGSKVDATRMASVAVPEKLLTRNDHGLVRPVADGTGEIVASLGGQSVTIPVKVRGTSEPAGVGFIRHVMPVMSKLGCNQGTCHGSKDGQNGFQLSLRGYDPVFDYRALTDDLEGRRFNRAAPDRSLMLLKTSGQVPHVGGVLTEPGDPNYEILRAWVAQGVQVDADTPRVASIEVVPSERTIALPGMKQQLAVYATYTDGSVRDVTAEAFVESSNTEVCTVDSQLLVDTVRRGEAVMLARYEGRYAASSLVVMGDRSGFEWQPEPQLNFIDELVDRKLQRMRINPSGLCDDATFLRRVYLDLTGLPPSPEEVRAFLADDRPTQVKRGEVIDQLVGSPAYVEKWTNRWASLLQVNRKFLGEEGAWAFRQWVREAIADNMPYDEFAQSILTASGSVLENPPAAYYKVLREPDVVMENTTQLFLAIRFNCNKCHDHPFEKWTQDQYYHLAAFFAQVGRKPGFDPANRRIGGTAVEGAKPLVEIVYDTGSGEVKHDRTGEVTPPAFPYEHAGQPGDEGNRRERLSEWLTSPENPYFAKSYVNRIWSYLLGLGLIEPVDDIRAGNPPSNPELLDALTTHFIENGWDTRDLMRLICRSRTYQASVETNRWNADDAVNYSHAYPRRLPAETLYDAVHEVTGSQRNLPGLPAGRRAVELPDSSVQVPGGFLNLFGRPPRESACECERTTGVMLGPVLNLVNGPVIADAIKDPNNRVTKLVKEIGDDRQLIEALYVAVLNRLPSEEEVALLAPALEAPKEDVAKARADYEDYATQTLPERLATWEQRFGEVTTWQTVTPTQTTGNEGIAFAAQPDGSVKVEGANPEKATYRVTLPAETQTITGIRFEAMADDSLPAKGPGRAQNGNFVLSTLKLEITPAGENAKPRTVSLSEAQADFAQNGWPAAGAVDNNPGSGWAVMPQFGKTHTLIAQTTEDVVLKEGETATLVVDQQYGSQHTIGRFRVSVTTSPRPLRLQGPAEPLATILKTPADQRTEEQKATLLTEYAKTDSEYRRLKAALETAEQHSANARLTGAQDIVWALINSPAFLFIH